MKHLSIALTFALVGLALPRLVEAQDFDASGEQSMLARINAMRGSQGLAPLARHPALDAAARAHSSDMATQQTLTHVSPSSGTPADRVRTAGVAASTVTENVALHRSTDEAHQALLGSDAHRQNMLSPDVTHAGLASLRSEQGVYVTQLFARIGEPPAEEPPAEVVEAPEPAREVTPELPAPSIELTPVPAPEAQAGPPEAQAGQVEQGPIAGPGPAAPVAPSSGHRPRGPTSLSPDSNGLVVLQHAPDRSRVQGYWVYGSGRWWYYPMPPGAQPGQQLSPDMSVQGPPEGFPAHPGGAHAQVAPPQAYRPQGPQAYRIVRPQTHPMPPPGPGAAITIAPGQPFYAVPPPPMVGQPTRAWRRAHRRWQRRYRRWLRRHRHRPL